jgi:hypothetical protein
MSPTKKGIHQNRKKPDFVFFLPENIKISFIVEIPKIGKTEKNKFQKLSKKF